MSQTDKHVADGNPFAAPFKDSRKPLDLRPTYPLDVDQIHSLRELAICDSPKLLVWQLLAQLGSRFTLLSRFSESWSQVEPQLCEAVVEHVVKQSNIAQNQVVNCLIDVLRDRHRNEYADTLSRFLKSKQSIELALKTNRSLASQRADVETIVDSIMQEVCNEIFLLSDLESDLAGCLTISGDADRIARLEACVDKSRNRISQAYKTMVETETQTTFQQPQQKVSDPTISESVVLDKLIDALRQENDLARTVNERIVGELPDCE